MGIRVDISGAFTSDQIAKLVRTATLAYGQFVRNELMNQKPGKPARGKFVYKSVKQRRFVYANMKNGNISVPYVRGRGAKLRASQTLNTSFRVNLEGSQAILTSSADYAVYVVGDEQAPIHAGRWQTAQAAAELVGNRDLPTIVEQIFNKELGA
jgi:hypothetical protein